MLIMSHSGLRGIAPKWLTPELAIRAAIAFTRVTNSTRVLVCRDTRTTSPLLAKAVIAGLLSEGVRVIDAGIAPTPVAFFAVRKLNLDGAIVITGSHNPGMWNAIKMASREGTFLKGDLMDKVISSLRDVRPTCKDYGKVMKFDIVDIYIKFAKEIVDQDYIKKASPKVLVDPASGAACHVTPRLLKEVGCKVTTINSSPEVYFREYEPTKSSLKTTALILKSKYDIGLAHDCDGDRLVLISPKGEVLDPNFTLALALEGFYEKFNHRGSFVINFATSNLVRDIAKKLGFNVYYSKIGEVHVLEEMERRGALIGGEGSSAGVIFRELNPTRDGILAALMILEYLSREHISIDEYIREAPKYYGFHDKVSLDSSSNVEILLSQIENVVKKDLEYDIEVLDGIKVIIDDNSWVLFRPSRTEFCMRIIGESPNIKLTERIRKWALSLMEGIIKGKYP